MISLEEALAGEIVYNTKLIPEVNFETFALEAASFHRSKYIPLNSGLRIPDFTLVLGSSGSGKTLFAIRQLPQLLFGPEKSKTYFRVHFDASDALDAMNLRASLTFPKAVASIVNNKISDFLHEKNADCDGIAVQLRLHIIIDEAGKEEYQEHFETALQIKQIVEVVKNETKVKFRRGVHVTVAGTGLDKVTARISSAVETIKFRMQPWTVENFEALVKASRVENQQQVKDFVRDFAILGNLITNGRCAFFLLSTLQKCFL